jgi:putative transposase
VEIAGVLSRTGDFANFLGAEGDAEAVAGLRRAYATGRPVGAAEWIARLEGRVGRALAPGKRGPKPPGGDRGPGDLFS